MTCSEILDRLQFLGNPEIAKNSQRYFKTGPGEYGEGDLFVGIRVPVVRKLAKEFDPTPLSEVLSLLQSPIHEARLLALLLWVRIFTRGDETTRGEIYGQYLKNTGRINNWDLVDLSAGPIVGGYLAKRSKAPLHRLAQSKSLWERRIAIMATSHDIQNHKFEETLKISKLLLNDPEDLIHKAVGWMLREVGKRDLRAEKAFLRQYYRTMPRTMLRYAIERFPEEERRKYLEGKINDSSPESSLWPKPPRRAKRRPRPEPTGRS